MPQVLRIVSCGASVEQALRQLDGRRPPHSPSPMVVSTWYKLTLLEGPFFVQALRCGYWCRYDGVVSTLLIVRLH